MDLEVKKSWAFHLEWIHVQFIVLMPKQKKESVEQRTRKYKQQKWNEREALVNEEMLDNSL